MNTATCTPNVPDPTAMLDIHMRASRAGLQSIAHLAVMDALVAHTDVAAGEATTAMSQYELAEITGLPVSCVQRALVTLRNKGLIARHQLVRQKGCVSTTLIAPKGLALYGLVVVGESLPPALAQMLINQPLSLVQEIGAAWHDCRLPNADAQQLHRGTSESWTAIEALLGANVERQHDALLSAVDAQSAAEEAEVRGELLIGLDDGSVVTLDGHTLQRCAPQPVDLRFLRETLLRVSSRGRGRVTRTTVSQLVAEAAYSRAVGFVRGHTWDEGVRVLSSVMAKPTWSRPRSIRETWYLAAQQSLSSPGCTRGSVSLH